MDFLRVKKYSLIPHPLKVRTRLENLLLSAHAECSAQQQQQQQLDSDTTNTGEVLDGIFSKNEKIKNEKIKQKATEIEKEMFDYHSTQGGKTTLETSVDL